MRINKFDVKKALLDHLMDNAQGIEVIPEGSNIQPKTDKNYLREQTRFGVNEITIDPNGKDNLNGIYQIDVCTPIKQQDFYNIGKCDLIIDSFGKGRSAGISHDGQVIEIQNIDISAMDKDDTHIIHYISVTFRAV